MSQYYKILTTCNQVDLLIYELPYDLLQRSVSETRLEIQKKISKKTKKPKTKTNKTKAQKGGEMAENGSESLNISSLDITKLEIGQAVGVEVGTKKYLGIVWDGPFKKDEIHNEIAFGSDQSIKKIEEIYWFLVNQTQIELLDTFTKQTFNPAGAFLEAFLRPFFGLSKGRQKAVQLAFFKFLLLTSELSSGLTSDSVNFGSSSIVGTALETGAEKELETDTNSNLDRDLEGFSDTDLGTISDGVSNAVDNFSSDNSRLKNFWSKNTALEGFLRDTLEFFSKKQATNPTESTENKESRNAQKTSADKNPNDNFQNLEFVIKLNPENEIKNRLKNLINSFIKTEFEAGASQDYKQNHYSGRLIRNILIVVPEKKYFGKIEKILFELEQKFQKFMDRVELVESSVNPYKNSCLTPESNNPNLSLNIGFYAGDGNKQNQLAVNSTLSYLDDLDNCLENTLLTEAEEPKSDIQSPSNGHNLDDNPKKRSLNINIICATRSGIFLPFLNLDEIFLLEENSTFYIQEQNGLYFDTRDLLFFIHSKYRTKLTFISSLPSVRLYSFYQNHNLQELLQDLATFDKTTFVISQRNYKNQIFGYKIEEILSGLDNLD